MRLASRVLAAFLPACVLQSTLLAQGADLCASAQVIAGTGAFAFDNTTATTDGQPDLACNYFSTMQINNDVWFSWVAPTTEAYTVSTCGQTSLDTRLSIMDGSCAGPVLACSDDFCPPTLQSSSDVFVTSGNTYIIRIGSFGATASGTGTFSIQPTVQLSVLDTQVNPANGHTYHLLSPGTWTAAENTAIFMGGHLTSIQDFAENEWIRSTWQNFQAMPRDLWIGFTDRLQEGTFAWSDGAPTTYTNWDPGEPNNALAGEDYGEIRRDSPTGNWNDLLDELAPGGFFTTLYGVVEVSSNPGTAFCVGDGSGAACPCGNNSAPGSGEGCLSSLGVGGKVAGSGNASVANDTLALTGSNMPSSTCLYFQGTTQLGAGAGVAFGDGLRCAGGTIIRLGTKTNVAGTSQYPVGADLPVSVKGAVPASGATRSYQVWYRNAAAFCTVSTFNLTNGLSIAWQP
jgi:hypothetical protein